jgi:hypothetical protein
VTLLEDRNSAAENVLSSLTLGRLKEGTTPRRWRVAKSVEPFIVVGVQDELAAVDTLGGNRWPDEIPGVFGGLLVTEVAAHDLAAPHIDDGSTTPSMARSSRSSSGEVDG